MDKGQGARTQGKGKSKDKSKGKDKGRGKGRVKELRLFLVHSGPFPSLSSIAAVDY